MLANKDQVQLPIAIEPDVLEVSVVLSHLEQQDPSLWFPSDNNLTERTRMLMEMEAQCELGVVRSLEVLWWAMAKYSTRELESFLEMDLPLLEHGKKYTWQTRVFCAKRIGL